MADHDPEALELKSISSGGVERALEKALRYRMIHEPGEAESICRDVLAVRPDDERALVYLVLALTDQFPRGLTRCLDAAWDSVARIGDEYLRAYYSGIICERRAKAHHRQRTPGCGDLAHHWLVEAMQHYERAESLKPPDNDDAVLRWNACLRFMRRHADIKPSAEAETGPPAMLE